MEFGTFVLLIECCKLQLFVFVKISRLEDHIYFEISTIFIPLHTELLDTSFLFSQRCKGQKNKFQGWILE